MRFQPNDLLGRRYRIVSVLGQGGMGTVYLADDIKLPGKRWAIKETMHAPSDFRQFVDEAEMLTRLDHPGLPRIVDYFAPDDEGFSYLVMDYIQGTTLLEWFERRERKTDTATAVRIAIQLCELFHYLHHEQRVPVVYRDLKPSNVMIDESCHIRLIDFGVARSYKQGQTSDTLQLGTIGFASPEQFLGKQTDGRSDLYSLGALLYYLLSGGKYFYTVQKPLDQVATGLPERLTRLVGKLLRSAPNERYQTAQETMRELEDMLPRAPATAAEQGREREPGSADVTASPASTWIGTLSVAVTSVRQGAGATHTALLVAGTLAAWLGGRNPVALVEANASGDFARIEAAYEGIAIIARQGKFAIGGVDFYKCCGTKQLPAIFAGGYRVVVLDIGCCEAGSPWFDEFVRAHLPIVVGAGCEWRQPDISRFAESHSDRDQSNWLYGIPLAEKTTIGDIAKSLPGTRVAAIPPHPDPFRRQSDTDAVLAQWIGPAFGVPRRKRWRIFGSKGKE